MREGCKTATPWGQEDHSLAVHIAIVINFFVVLRVCMQKARVDIDKNSTLWYRTRRKMPLELDSPGERQTVAEMNFFELKMVYKIQSLSYSSLFCCMHG